MSYTLATSGDDLERSAVPLFLSSDFPEYERYWARDVVPLTGRPTHIHFLDDTSLASAGRTPEDVCKAQLHYTALRNLYFVWQRLQPSTLAFEDFVCAMMRVVSIQDVAFELLERHAHPGHYSSWSDQDGRRARAAWQKAQRNPLQEIRDYRNHVAHGRMLPCVVTPSKVLVPTLGKQTAYLDWRKVTENSALQQALNSGDLVTTNVVLRSAWDQTISYLRAAWRQHLGV